MIALMELFLLPAARIVGGALLVEAVGILVAQKAGIDPMDSLAAAVPLGGIALAFSLLQYFPRNMSWTIGLPFSKRQLALATYLIGAAILVLVGVGQTLLALGVCLVVYRAELSWAKFGALWHALDWPSAQLGELVNLNVVSAALITLAVLHAVCVSSRVGRARPMTQARVRRQRMIVAGAIAACWLGAASGLDTLLLQPIMIYCLIVAGSYLLPIEALARSLAMPAPQHRRFRVAAAVVTGAQCTVLFALAFHDLRSGEAWRVSNAYTSLGTIAGRVDEESLVHALKGKAGKESLAILATIYRQQHGHGLTVQNALQSRRNAAEVVAVMNAFDPRELRFADLLPLMVWFRQAPPGLSAAERRPAARHIVTKLARMPLEIHEAKALLEMPAPEAHELAIVWARYHRQPELLDAILAKRDALDRPSQELAKVTVAILRGVRPEDDLGRAVASTFYPEPDCKPLDGILSSPVPLPSSEALLNVCLRKRALEKAPALIPELENLGWVTLPASARSQALFKKLRSH